MKKLFKALANGLSLVLVFPLIVWSHIGFLVLRGERLYGGAAFALAGLSGDFGIYVRRAFYRFVLRRSLWDLALHYGSVITHPSARIGKRVYIGAYCLIGTCHIEDDVIIGSRVSIPSGRHQHQFDEPGKKISEQNGTYEEITVGHDAWIGEGAIVMANIGAGAVVGAGSVVVREVSPASVVVGNPAREIGRRGRELESG